MKFTQRTRGIVQAIAVVLSLAVPVMFAISAADARVGGGGSSGSRGGRTFSAPPSTSTAPGTAQPFNRTITQPGSPGMAGPAAAGAASKGGFFNRPGMGMLGGLAAGFLGAGLLGMLFGGGMFSGLGGLSSIIGLILQIGLIIIVVRLAMSWWQRRHAPPPPRPMPARRPDLPSVPATAEQLAHRNRLRPRIGQRAAGDSARPTTKPSSGCSARSRPRGRTRTSPSCTRWRPPKWCRISPRTSRRTRPATTSTRSPTSSCCRATSRKPGAKAIPTTPAWRCGSRWSTRRWSAAPAGWSRAATADRGDGGVDLRAAARRRLGTLGDPADH